jgi:hypothetical protein
MKQLLIAAGLGLSLAACTTTGWSEAPRDDSYYVAAAPVGWWGRDAVSVDLFYAPLAIHGTWGLHPRYGRVFLPGVGPGWQPYANGYWRQDPRLGRAWVSAEPWGWATYHYGRWGRDIRLGWFWVPDTRFGPGWVDWRTGGGFVSWSPLPPRGWGSWSNDWWLHAPAGWAYRPGLHQHFRPGRHDWNRDRDRDRYDRDRPGRDGGQQSHPPRAPVQIPDSAVPPPPAWVGGERQPDAPGYRRGERQRSEGLQGGVHPRSTPPPREARPALARAEPTPAPARAEVQRREPPARVREAPPPDRVREAPRGRDVPAKVADD